ncbi:hypothetical protein GQ457_08G017900 [Hibiscus cannabinus]
MSPKVVQHGIRAMVIPPIIDSLADLMISNNESMCLDDTIFLLWKQHLLFTIRGLGLEEYIDSKTSKPAKHVMHTNGKRAMNPAYVQFVKQDNSLASWLLFPVSTNILHQLVGVDTSADIWNVVIGLFAKLSTTKVLHLHSKLRSMKKVSEVEHIATILNGLPREYATFVAVFTSSQTLYSLDGVVSGLCDAEPRFVDSMEAPIGINLSQYQQDDSTKAEYNQPSSNRGRGRGLRNSFTGGGVTSSQSRQLDASQANTCQYQPAMVEQYYKPSVASNVAETTDVLEEFQSLENVHVNLCN